MNKLFLIFALFSLTACYKDPVTFSIVSEKAHQVVEQENPVKVAFILVETEIKDMNETRPTGKVKIKVHNTEMELDLDSVEYDGVTSVHQRLVEDLQSGRYPSHKGIQKLQSYLNEVKGFDIDFVYKPSCSPNFVKEQLAIRKKLTTNYQGKLSERMFTSNDSFPPVINTCAKDLDADIVILSNFSLIAMNDQVKLYNEKSSLAEGVNKVAEVYKDYYGFSDSPFAIFTSSFVVMKPSNEIVYLGIAQTHAKEARDIPEHFGDLFTNFRNTLKMSKNFVK